MSTFGRINLLVNDMAASTEFYRLLTHSVHLEPANAEPRASAAFTRSTNPASRRLASGSPVGTCPNPNTDHGGFGAPAHPKATYDRRHHRPTTPFEARRDPENVGSPSAEADGLPIQSVSRTGLLRCANAPWWAEKDLNLRRHTPAELQSASFGRSDTDPCGPRSSDAVNPGSTDGSPPNEARGS